MPQFKFIGEEFNYVSAGPVLKEYCSHLRDRPEHFAHSGDYSAATDHLKLEPIEIVGEEIVR